MGGCMCEYMRVQGEREIEEEIEEKIEETEEEVKGGGEGELK